MMMRATYWTAALGLAAIIGLGCGGEGETTGEGVGVVSPPEATGVTPETPASDTDVETAPIEGEPTTSTEVKLSDDEIAQIKLLPAEDQILALAQKVCPSSNEPLGSMGQPVKVVVGDQAIFACCGGCEDDIKENFHNYVAKLSMP